jgi:hypothetical protein
VQGFPKSRSLLAGNAAFNPSNYESIQTITVGSGGAASINFTSIPSTYKHLQIRGIGRATNSTGGNQAKLQMNGDTSSGSYAFHQLVGNGFTASAYGYGTGTVDGMVPVIVTTSGLSASNIFGVTVIDILDYTSTQKYKTVRSFTGRDTNGGGDVQLTSGLWLSTSAITSLNILMQSAGDFAEYSTLALYGVK